MCFMYKGYFIGELGNFMVLVMVNVLKMLIVIFLLLENYFIILILLCWQLNDMFMLFVLFNVVGCGYYDYVFMENV